VCVCVCVWRERERETKEILTIFIKFKDFLAFALKACTGSIVIESLILNFGTRQK